MSMYARREIVGLYRADIRPYSVELSIHRGHGVGVGAKGAEKNCMNEKGPSEDSADSAVKSSSRVE